MLAEIENRLFVGGTDKKGKNPMYCLNSLDSKLFRCTVKFIVYQLKYDSFLPYTIVNTITQNVLFCSVRSAGEIMAVSLAQGGPCPTFLREWCFSYICSGDSDNIEVSDSDVTDPELSMLVERVIIIGSQYLHTMFNNMSSI